MSKQPTLGTTLSLSGASSAAPAPATTYPPGTTNRTIMLQSGAGLGTAGAALYARTTPINMFFDQTPTYYVKLREKALTNVSFKPIRNEDFRRNVLSDKDETLKHEEIRDYNMRRAHFNPVQYLADARKHKSDSYTELETYYSSLLLLFINAGLTPEDATAGVREVFAPIRKVLDMVCDARFPPDISKFAYDKIVLMKKANMLRKQTKNDWDGTAPLPKNATFEAFAAITKAKLTP